MVNGIHHITAISSDPQKTYDFYSKVLGLRLVKKTVNQDDPETYHLFFGDKYGHPGMDLTFFTFQPPRIGRRGTGLVTKISFAVPLPSLEFWKKRFHTLKVKYSADIINKRILFFDEDDLQLELVGVENENISESNYIWTTHDILTENAIRSFYSATLMVSHKSLIEPILTDAFGYKKTSVDKNFHSYQLENTNRASIIEIKENDTEDYGISGAGTVHHIAFGVKDEDEEISIRSKLVSMGLMPTQIIDRFYFKSVYFRTRAGILFELATETPGFTSDEKEEDLGQRLSLPPFLESQRKEIESKLVEINTA
jgi:glyoxalase family protein